jgi:hypothetical protein
MTVFFANISLGNALGRLPLTVRPDTATRIVFGDGPTAVEAVRLIEAAKVKP